MHKRDGSMLSTEKVAPSKLIPSGTLGVYLLSSEPSVKLPDELPLSFSPFVVQAPRTRKIERSSNAAVTVGIMRVFMVSSLYVFLLCCKDVCFRNAVRIILLGIGYLIHRVAGDDTVFGI